MLVARPAEDILVLPELIDDFFLVLGVDPGELIDDSREEFFSIVSRCFGIEEEKRGSEVVGLFELFSEGLGEGGFACARATVEPEERGSKAIGVGSSRAGVGALVRGIWSEGAERWNFAAINRLLSEMDSGRNCRALSRAAFR